MTNAEYFEKNGVSFSESMKLFNESKIKSFDEFLSDDYDEFLSDDHIEHKFKIGDIVVLQLNGITRAGNWTHNVVFEIINITKLGYDVKFLTPSQYNKINDTREIIAEFIDNNCELY